MTSPLDLFKHVVCAPSFRVRLNKRRSKAKSAMNSKLVVRHREMTEDENYAQVLNLSLSLLVYVDNRCWFG